MVLSLICEAISGRRRYSWRTSLNLINSRVKYHNVKPAINESHWRISFTKEHPTNKDLCKVTILILSDIGESKDIQSRLSPSSSCCLVSHASRIDHTIDGKENGEGHATPHQKQNHHHSEISKEEVAILNVSFGETGCLTRPEWSMMKGSGDFSSGRIHPNLEPVNVSVRFLRNIRTTKGHAIILLGNGANKCSRFVDSLVLLSQLF